MSGNEGCQIMEFRPSMEEFKNFSAYIQKMESLGAHKGGIAKVIPPTEWFACRRYNMKKIGEMTIEAPVGQVVTGQQGLYQQFNVQKKPLKVKEFKELAESPKYIGPECEDLAKIERKYWKNITFNPPIYGADMPGSVYDSSVDVWNINRLHTILDILDTECSVKIQGVNTAYLYFGMWKTTFAWHTEDMDLYSINFLHFGAPKSWYAIPPEHGKRLESLAKGFFSGSAQDCPEFLRHKMTIISPQVLKRFSIPVNKITQYSGEFIITFPFGYHSGYNHGFNCAESTNFASERWIEYGKRASHCQCNSDSVKIDMNVFIRKYQPELWQKTEFQSGRGKASETNNTRVAPRAKYASESPSKKKKKEYDESDTAVHAGDSLKNRSLDCEGANGVVQVQNEHTSFSKSSGRQLGKSVFQTSKRHPVFVKHLHQGDIQTDLDVKNEEDHCDMNVKAGAGPMRTSCSFLEGLWSHEPLDLEKERQYNKVMSSTEARCAVCVFFSASDAKFLFSGSDDSRDVAREHRRLSDSAGGLLLVTELCFAATHSEKSSMETAFKLLFACGQQEALAIVTCADCQLTVHKSCYGLIEGTDQTQQTWYCDKCRALQEANGEETARSVRCCLCCLKGGALKRTTTGQWAHIVCGIGFPDVFFVDRQARGPIDISLLNPARRKLNCVYCNEFTRQTSVDRGACVQCKCGKCAVAFHVTCSFHNGIPLYHGDWPVLIEALCMKHSKCKKPKVESKRNLVDVSVGDAVMAKHRNGRYYKATVQEVVKVLYYKVVFEDKSFCFDLPPHDIQGVDATSTLLALGTDVRVAWRDGLTYKANVTGHWYDTVCQVRFEDTSILNIKRNDLFAEKEEIPNKIRSKMSYASETANLLYIADSLKGTTKRTRVSSRKSCRGALEKL